MNKITTVGVDLAKEVIVVCAGDAEGRGAYFKQFSFAGFAQWAMKLAPCAFGMEACSSAHHWARFLGEHGHTVKLIAAEFVAPFRKSQGAMKRRQQVDPESPVTRRKSIPPDSNSAITFPDSSSRWTPICCIFGGV